MNVSDGGRVSQENKISFRRKRVSEECKNWLSRYYLNFFIYTVVELQKELCKY